MANSFSRHAGPAALFWTGVTLCLWTLAKGGLRDLSPAASLFLGLSLMLVSIGAPARRAGWNAIRTEVAQPASSHRAIPFFALLAGQLAFAMLIAAPAFWLNRSQLLGYIDGQYLLTLVSAQANFAAPGLVLSSNPLQGLGDLWYSTNVLWIPELSIARLFSHPELQKVAIHVMAFAEVFATASLLAFWLGYSPMKAIASGWLAVLVFAPLTYPSHIYNISPDAPNIATSMTFPFAVILLWAGIGRGALWADAARTLAIGFLVWWHFIAVGVVTTLAYPLVGVVGAVFALASWPNHRNEFWRKMACGLVLAVLVFLSGLPQALIGTITDTAFHVFPEELPTREARSLGDGSILLRRDQPIGVITAALGIFGATVHAWYGTGRMQQFACGILIVIALILSAAVANVFVDLPGAVPFYYEYALWAVYPIFAVSILQPGWRLLQQGLLASMNPGVMPLLRWQWLLLPIVGLLVLHGPNYIRHVHTQRPNVYPPVATALTDFLRDQIGLAPGAPFRGRVVTLTGQTLPGPATWGQMFDLDMERIRVIGNDHRSIGLWYYHIPTLIEFSQTLPPLIYLVAKRYLAHMDDAQGRSTLLMRRTDVHVLRLLGVRYILTDGTPVAGTHRVLEITLPKSGGRLALDEIPNPNLGISPVHTMPPVSGKAALEWLGNSENDFEQTMIATEPVAGPLTPAGDIRITVETGGIRVRATSAGRSVVVLPFQYSHCLEAIPADQSNTPRLTRADLLLTAVVFEAGTLDAMVRYRQTAFKGARCRLDDFADDTELLRDLHAK